MKIVRHLHEFPADYGHTVMVLGTFDGFHAGHQKLIRTAQDIAKNKGASGAKIVIAGFHPPPGLFFQNRVTGNVLTLPSERAVLLADMSVDCHILMHFNRNLANMSADDFLGMLHRYTGFSDLIIGPDHAFGRARQGNVDYLRAASERAGFKLHVHRAVHMEEPCPLYPGDITDIRRMAIKSSIIRDMLKKGHVEAAKSLLGRPYSIIGRVRPGRKLGRTMDIPTANIVPPAAKLLPPDGVYGGLFQEIKRPGTYLLQKLRTQDLKSRQADSISVTANFFRAAIYIGKAPTVNGNRRRVEVHVPDYKEDLYGRRVGLYLLQRIRGDVRFGSMKELAEQIRKDIDIIGSVG